MKKIIRFLEKTIVPVTAMVVLFSCVPLGYAREGMDEKDISLEGSKTRSYTLNLKQLVKQAEKNMKKVEGDIEERKIDNRNQQREEEVRKHFEKGNTLHKKGKLKEAKKEWQKALKISKDPEMRNYIRGSVKRTKQEEIKRGKEEKKRVQLEKKKRKEELKRQKKLEAKKKDELKRQKKLEKKKRLEEAKRQKKLEAEKKAKERHEKLAWEEAKAKQKQKQNKKVASLLSEARSLYKKKEYTRAEAKYRDVLKLDKENKIALRYLVIIPGKI